MLDMTETTKAKSDQLNAVMSNNQGSKRRFGYGGRGTRCIIHVCLKI